jgi:hypothetical protein
VPFAATGGMRYAAATLLLLLAAACTSSHVGGTSSTALPGHGAIALSIKPNPIVAQHVSGSTYEFPFEVSLRETGGHPVTIQRVSADVFGPGGIRVGNESYDAARIASLGFPTSVAGNGELRYRFAPRKSVPNEGLLSSVYAEVRVEATDEQGTPATATVNVTITR